ncbi:hypothetical protein [Lacunimicrobium album]
MDILSQDHEEFIRQVVDQGEFTSRQQVLEAAVERLMVESLLQNAELEGFLTERLKALDQGDVIEYDEEGFKQLHNELDEELIAHVMQGVDELDRGEGEEYTLEEMDSLFQSFISESGNN